VNLSLNLDPLFHAVVKSNIILAITTKTAAATFEISQAVNANQDPSPVETPDHTVKQRNHTMTGSSWRKYRLTGSLMLILAGYLFQLTRLQQRAHLHVVLNTREMSHSSTIHTNPTVLRNLPKIKSGAKKRLALLRNGATNESLNAELHAALNEFRMNRPPAALELKRQAAKEKAAANEAARSARAARAGAARAPSEGATGDPPVPLVHLPEHSCQIGNETFTMKEIPSFIIVGTQKGGTSTLHGLLRSHPAIVAAKRFEPHFFDRDPLMLEYRKDLTPENICILRRHYAETVFPTGSLHAYPRLSFEKSPAYMVVPGIPTLIKKVVPWAKIIVTLRNPVDRSFSHFRMKREREQESRELEAVLGDELSHLRQYPYFDVPDNAPFEIPVANNTYSANLNITGGNNTGTVQRRRPKLQGILYRGCYHHQLRNWFRHYTLGENLLVVNYERLDLDPESVLEEILDFVGAPEYEFTDQAFNKSYSPSRHWNGRYTESMSNTTRQYLEDFYRPMNDKLADMLGEEWRGIWDKEHRSRARTIHVPARPAKGEREDVSKESEEEDEDEDEQ
jgi:hypothetical protein